MGRWVGGLGGVEKLILKLTSASTGVGVEAWAELGNLVNFYEHSGNCSLAHNKQKTLKYNRSTVEKNLIFGHCVF